MTLVHCSGDEARDTRDNTMGAEVDRPSWREAREDEADVTKAIAADLNGSGVRREFCDHEGRAYWWELTHAAARRWADRNARP